MQHFIVEFGNLFQPAANSIRAPTCSEPAKPFEPANDTPATNAHPVEASSRWCGISYAETLPVEFRFAYVSLYVSLF
jgi:hypothetical protein